MDQTVVGVSRALGDAFAVEARKQRGRASSVKALIVIEDANLQNAPLRDTKSVQRFHNCYTPKPLLPSGIFLPGPQRQVLVAGVEENATSNGNSKGT
jgi:hypothetical protein